MCSTDHNKILHTSQQCNCRDWRKISLWSVKYILNQSTSNFGRISNRNIVSGTDTCCVNAAFSINISINFLIHWSQDFADSIFKWIFFQKKSLYIDFDLTEIYYLGAD